MKSRVLCTLKRNKAGQKHREWNQEKNKKWIKLLYEGQYYFEDHHAYLFEKKNFNEFVLLRHMFMEWKHGY